MLLQRAKMVYILMGSRKIHQTIKVMYTLSIIRMVALTVLSAIMHGMEMDGLDTRDSIILS